MQTNQRGPAKALHAQLYVCVWGVGVNHQHWNLAETPRRVEEREGFTAGQRGGSGLPCWRLLGWGRWRPADRKWGVLCAWSGAMSAFLWLVLSWKQGQKLGKLSVTDGGLDILGQLLQKLFFSFLDYP